MEIVCRACLCVLVVCRLTVQTQLAIVSWQRYGSPRDAYPRDTLQSQSKREEKDAAGRRAIEGCRVLWHHRYNSKQHFQML